MEDTKQTGSEKRNTTDQTNQSENSTDADGESTGIERDEDNIETRTANPSAVQEGDADGESPAIECGEDNTETQTTNPSAVQDANANGESTGIECDEDSTETQTASPSAVQNANADEKSTAIECDEDNTETQTKNPSALQEDVKNIDSRKINVENADEVKNLISKSLKKIQDNNISGAGEIKLSGRKSEHKKHATFSEEAPTITITGEDSCPESPTDINSDNQEVNNNTEKPVIEENENKSRCPIYFGIKSYLHQFYAPPDKDVLNSGEYIQEDDFEFVVEPGKRRWRGFWFRVGMWVGVNLILLGLIALLVGYLTPPRQTIVGLKENLEILDRWAIAFNRRLEICRFAGLCVFCCGAVIVMLTLLVSSYQQETTYYVVGATVVPETFVGNPLVGQQQRWNSVATCRIPITGTIRNIQPSILSNN